MQKQISIEIDLPSLPNFIKAKDGKSVIPIREFTEEELLKIGEEWTKALIKKSKEQHAI